MFGRMELRTGLPELRAGQNPRNLCALLIPSEKDHDHSGCPGNRRRLLKSAVSISGIWTMRNDMNVNMACCAIQNGPEFSRWSPGPSLCRSMYTRGNQGERPIPSDTKHEVSPTLCALAPGGPLPDRTLMKRTPPRPRDRAISHREMSENRILPLTAASTE